MADGTVCRPPYATAKGLIDWAIDLWPYVNGKAIMHGVRLKELEASDMLDVMHFMFEEDALSSPSGEHLEAKERVRQMMYSEMYNRPYKYLSTGSSGVRYEQGLIDDELSAEDVPVPVDPVDRSRSEFASKRYIPPTAVNFQSPKPFGSAIDSPLA